MILKRISTRFYCWMGRYFLFNKTKHRSSWGNFMG